MAEPTQDSPKVPEEERSFTVHVCPKCGKQTTERNEHGFGHYHRNSLDGWTLSALTSDEFVEAVARHRWDRELNSFGDFRWGQMKNKQTQRRYMEEARAALQAAIQQVGGAE